MANNLGKLLELESV